MLVRRESALDPERALGNDRHDQSISPNSSIGPKAHAIDPHGSMDLDEEQVQLLASLHAFTLRHGLERGKSLYPSGALRLWTNLPQ